MWKIFSAISGSPPVRTTTNIPKRKLSGLQVYLVDELPRRGDDDGFRLLEFAKGTRSDTVCHQLLQDGQQEGSLQTIVIVKTPTLEQL